MLSVLLSVLKILGIILLALLGIILILILLILLVPVRYRIRARRKAEEEVPIMADIRVTWFWHILNASFSYPEAAFLRVRCFCFTIFRSDRRQNEKDAKRSGKKSARTKNMEKENTGRENIGKDIAEKDNAGNENVQGEPERKETPDRKGAPVNEQLRKEKKEVSGRRNKIFEFFGKLWKTLKNIKYTITRICDKIKHIVKNIQYYLKILKSDTFSRAWNTCSDQVFALLKSIFPRKISGSLLIGTGDPAGTGQVLAAYGILYPLLGNHIDMIPDFERQILEGDLFVKGKITVFRVLKTAWIVYFNKDLRKLIKLFKREAA